MDVKAIETHYKGYRFRSRLEARYAVMLEHLGIRWEYEYQGYTTRGGPYLPDFWLPDHGLYIEIKPDMPTEEERAKVCHIRDEVAPIAVLIGPPGDYLGKLFCHDIGGSSAGSSDWDCQWVFDPRPEHLSFKIGVACAHPQRELVGRDFNPVPGIVNTTWTDCYPEHHRLLDAYATARAARFEHGETPR